MEAVALGMNRASKRLVNDFELFVALPVYEPERSGFVVIRRPLRLRHPVICRLDLFFFLLGFGRCALCRACDLFLRLKSAQHLKKLIKTTMRIVSVEFN